MVTNVLSGFDRVISSVVLAREASVLGSVFRGSISRDMELADAPANSLVSAFARFPPHFGAKTTAAIIWTLRFAMISSGWYRPLFVDWQRAQIRENSEHMFIYRIADRVCARARPPARRTCPAYVCVRACVSSRVCVRARTCVENKRASERPHRKTEDARACQQRLCEKKRVAAARAFVLRSVSAEEIPLGRG